MTWVRWVRARAGELTRFATVGVVGVLVNLAVFNALRLGPLGPEATFAGDDDRVITAKIIATAVSIAFAWWAHRGWTFRGRARHRPSREATIFAGVNIAALVVEAAVVAVSYYWLGFRGLAAENAATLVGIGLGTITRYLGYTLFVFSPASAPASTPTDRG